VLRIAEGVTKCLLDIKTIGFMAEIDVAVETIDCKSYRLYEVSILT